MTRDEAKKVLMLYRPGVIDENDRNMAEALELVQRDPELAAWFEQQCAVFDAIRGKLKSIPVPQNLRRRIISQHTAETRVVPLGKRVLLAASIAALVLLTTIVWIKFQPNPQDRFEGYRDRMARTVQRLTYPMEMHGKDQAKIRDYFASKGAPTNYVLPAVLGNLPGEGGMVLKWHDHQVCLLCLDASNNTGTPNDLYLFMANRSVIPGAPAGKKPEFKTIGGFMTATWTVGDRLYLLAAKGDEATLQKYLE